MPWYFMIDPLRDSYTGSLFEPMLCESAERPPEGQG
jgi:hypothetical protein